MSFNEAVSNFHFLRPLWFIALPLFWLLVVWLAKRDERDGSWSAVIDKEMLQALRLDTSNVNGMRPWPWLALLWTLAVVSLAGPSWEHYQTAAYRAPADWVFVLDLSPSMATRDMIPDRVSRARYALDDLLGAARDARVALVAFSDEPYAVAPLTQDIATIRALLPPLAPDIMPSPGDHLSPALRQAEDLLHATGKHDQRIIVLTDGFDDPAASFTTAAELKAHGITLSVIGIGTTTGAPLQNAAGHFAPDAQGHTQLTRLNVDQLRQLAQAGGGGYVDIAQVPRLIAYLQSAPNSIAGTVAAKGVEVSHWRDAGVWLLPILVLIAAVLTRRGWL